MLLSLTPVGPTVNASNQSGPQSEVGIAVNPLDPLNLVAVANDVSDLTRLATYYSLDGGATWATNFIDENEDGLGPEDLRFDPNVAFDSDGNVYVIYGVSRTSGADLSVLIVAQSSDSGANYTQATQAAVDAQPGTIHTPMVTTRTNPNGPDSVLATWALVVDAGERIQASLSTDGGATFPVINSQINDDAPQRTFLPWAAADNAGNFHVIWEVNLPGTTPDGRFFHDVLDGTTLAGGVDGVVSDIMITDFSQASSQIPAQPDRGIWSVGTIDVDRSGGPFTGRIYVTYGDRATISTNDVNIFLRYSDDNGCTWSDPIRINDDTTTNSQFLPRMALDQATGAIFVIWYDTREDAANQLAHLYTSVSLDGGLTWKANVRLTEEPSNESITNPQRYLGNYLEYIGMSAYGGVAYGAWTDARASNFTAGLQEEIFVGGVRANLAITVQIDIKPGGFPNSINLNSNGVLPVAVLTTPTFNAASVDTRDLSTLRFGDVNLSGRVSPLRAALEDVDHDGDIDLILHFCIRQIRDAGALASSSTLAELTGVTTDGTAFRGTDSVRIVPAGRRRCGEQQHSGRTDRRHDRRDGPPGHRLGPNRASGAGCSAVPGCGASQRKQRVQYLDLVFSSPDLLPGIKAESYTPRG